MSEENKLKKILDLICSWVGCVDNEFSCSIKDSENLYKDEEQVITYINDLFTENKRLREALEEIKKSLNREKSISDRGYDVDMKNWLIGWYNETKRIVNTALKNKH